ncbi:MAG: dihydroorotate dehydrogenase electron transfer subunit, partial [Pseudomonadota bacterium]
QFLMLEVPGFPLRRPFVIADKDGDKIRVIFKLRGKGTAALKEIKPGTELKVLAPLGTPFPAPEKDVTTLLVGGGMGIATLMPLAKKLSKDGNIKALLGADTMDSLLLVDEFKKLCEIITCTDDGTCGTKCNAVELTKEYISKNKGKYCIYACGPDAMLKNISKLAKSENIKCHVSLEERMACGVGACLCCAVKTTKGIQRVCKDGPVFDSDEILWD